MGAYNFDQLDTFEYQKAVKSSLIKPRFRLSILNPDESIKEDISQYLLMGTGTLNINYSIGKRRSLNFDLNNESGKFNPTLNYLWINTRFKLELGMEINGNTYYNSAGIFVISNPATRRYGAEKTITVQCEDKFAVLDNWATEATYTIPVNTNIRQAIKDILLLDNGNGFPIDTKPLIFDTVFKDVETAYTITKSPNESLGSIIIELAEMMGADCWYDVDGHLTFVNGTQDIAKIQKPILWHYTDDELEYISNEINYEFLQVKNRVIVVGANTNSGIIYSAIAENINPKSPTRISLIGTRNKYIEDSNIYSDSLALQRAQYELNKISMLQLNITVQSTYLIHLDVNECVCVTDSHHGYYDDKFVIQSLTVPIDIGSVISISCTNINQMPYYPSV